MRHSTNRQSFLRIMIVALLLAFAIPATASAQGRGRAYRKGDGKIHWVKYDKKWSKYDKKCAKFVNCHDARDGRWVRQGARGDRVGYVVLQNRRNRVRDRRIGRRYWLQRRTWVRNHRYVN